MKPRLAGSTAQFAGGLWPSVTALPWSAGMVSLVGKTTDHWGAWLPRSVEKATLDRGVVPSGSTLGVELT